MGNNIKLRTLSSGVKVILEKIDTVQSVAFGVLVRTGSVDENKDNSGISHFVEHMMFKGTKDRSAKKIAEDADKIGGQMNAFTSREATCYHIKTISENFEKGADIILDMLNNSVFDAREMTKERQVIVEEMKMTEDQPDELVLDKILELVYKGGDLAKSIIGTRTSLKKITRDVMVDYVRNQYTLDSMVVSISGNIDEERAISYLEGKFNNFKPSKAPRKKGVLPYEPSYSVIVKDIQQSHIALATKGVTMGDDRRYALAILSNIMGSGMSSRLFQNVREEKGLAYSVFSTAGNNVEDGCFVIYAGVSHEKIKDALDAIKYELDVLAKDGISDEEFEKAKTQIKANHIFGQESVISRMFSNGKNLLLLDKIVTSEEISENIDKVTMEDINEVIKLISDTSKYSVAITTNKRINIKSIWS